MFNLLITILFACGEKNQDTSTKTEDTAEATNQSEEESQDTGTLSD